MNETKVRVGIMAIGNELLLGQVQDTNTHWLCRQITNLGGTLIRTATVRDEMEAIIRELRFALAENFSLMITSGGLGPTPDDLTLSAVARAFDRKLALHPEALAMVTHRIRQLHQARLIPDNAMTASREKMAWLPEGALPLTNHVGTAPGVLLKVNATTIVSLPGVPAELKDIFNQALEPSLNSLFGVGFYLEKALLLDWNDESALAPLLEEIYRRWPHVYVKSRAKSFDQEFKVSITISMNGERGRVLREVDTVETFLRQQLTRRGISSKVL